jgi:release factor glutamine methyltransferase
MIEVDLQVLLCHVLQKPRSFLLTYPDYRLSSEEEARFNHLKIRYEQGEPLAYLLGTQGFWKHTFMVSPAVLIPRPETELLLEFAIKNASPGARVLELGTGSGCLAISFALERADCEVIAVDFSVDALAIANQNAKQIGAGSQRLDRLQFIQSNWFEALSGQRFDFIMSNPPYIAEADLHLKDLTHEPALALVSGATGLDALTLLIQQGVQYLNVGAILAVEHGYDQGGAVQHLFHQAQYQKIATLSDIQGHPRITWGRTKC